MTYEIAGIGAAPIRASFLAQPLIPLLLAEDNPIEREVYRELASSGILEERFHPILEAETAEEAKDLYRKHRQPMVVVVDGRLKGGESGVDLCRFLRRQKTFVMIFFISGDGDFEEAAIKEGALSFRGKPVAPALFRSQLMTAADAVSEHLRVLTERHFLSETVRDLLRDSLTGLMNRVYFEMRLSEELMRANREGKGIGVLFLDLFDFKGFNDTYGHAAGDRALQEAAGCIEKSVRSYDIAGRWAGDELVVAVRDDGDGKATREMAKRIRRAFATCNLEIRQRGAPLHVPVKVSVGYAVVRGAALSTDFDSEAKALIEKADAAMYRVKRRQHRRAGGTTR